jgi:hypothetical protein
MEENKLTSQETKDLMYQKCIKHLYEMPPFTDYIPSVPIMRSKEDYKEHVIPNFIRCGAIPKDKLVIGKTYIGHCRNADEAVWLGDKFEYNRTKFGCTFKEEINHFEDDDGYDLFVPLKEK